MEEIVESLLGADAYSFSWKPLAYVYQREESESKKRELVTLGALDRVLTTQIALILQKRLRVFGTHIAIMFLLGVEKTFFIIGIRHWGNI